MEAIWRMHIPQHEEGDWCGRGGRVDGGVWRRGTCADLERGCAAAAHRHGAIGEGARV